MTEILSKKITKIPLVQEENFLNWTDVLEKFKKKFWK